MKKEEYVAKHLNEAVGLLLSAFSNSDATRAGADPDMAARGRFMMHQMRLAREFLGRLYDDASPDKK